MQPPMQIAINISALPFQAEPAFRSFLQSLFQLWAVKMSGHQYLFIGTEEEKNFLNKESKNSSWLEAPLPGKKIANQFWQRVRLPALLKKNKTEILISTGGLNIIPSQIPVVLLVYGNDLHRGKDKGFAKTLQQAARIIVFADKDARQLSGEYNLPQEKIVVLKAAPAFPSPPLSFEEKAHLKNRYTGGKEFFMYSGIIGGHQNLTNLLKAFSVFKKRQGTGTRLLLEGPVQKRDKTFTDSLSHYKYRDELVLTGELPPAERASLIAAAYALVDPALRPHAGIPMLEAAAAGVPSIAVNGHPVLKEAAYLTADMNDYVDLAAGLMQLYKDEGLRNQLIQLITAHSPLYTVSESVDCFDKIMQPLLR